MVENLERKLQRKLDHSRGTNTEDAGAQTYAVCVRLLSGSAVRRPWCAAQNAAQRVGGGVKVDEIHDVKDGHARLQREPFFDFVGPAQSHIECPQPIHSGLVAWC